MSSNTKKIFIISIISLIFSTSAFAYLYYSVSQMRVDLDTQYTVLGEREAKLAELQRVEKNIKATTDNKEKLESFFPKQDSIVEFIQALENLARNLNLKASIDSVDESDPTELSGTGKERLDLSISANGNWEGIVKFIGAVENLPFKSVLDTASLSFGKSNERITGNEAQKPSQKEVWNIVIKMHALAEKSVDANTNQGI